MKRIVQWIAISLAACASPWLMHAAEDAAVRPDCISLDGRPAAPNPVNAQGRVDRFQVPVVRLMRTDAPARKGVALILPSGGYQVLSVQSDGVDKARFFNEQGFDAAILEYHVTGAGKAVSPSMRDLALQDALAAVRLLRKPGSSLGLAGGSFILAGASAGGHLAARTVATLPPPERPDLLVLFYPAYLEETPPAAAAPGMTLPTGRLPRLAAFMAVNDQPNWVKGLRQYAAAWQQGGGEAALEIYDDGGHGFHAGSHAAAAWPDRLRVLLAKTSPPAGPARFIQKLRQGQPVTIVTLGTSLTGGTWRWPDVMMQDWLNKDYPGRVTLHNLGVGASASSHPPGKSGLALVGKAAALKPDVVFIEFAVNDAYLPYKVSPEASRSNLNVMVDTLLSAHPGTEVILQTMNSCKDLAGSGPHASDRPRLDIYVEGYREVARQRGLRLVDHYPNWLKLMQSDPARFDQLVPDRIHPQQEGYRQILLPTLKQALTGQEAKAP